MRVKECSVIIGIAWLVRVSDENKKNEYYILILKFVDSVHQNELTVDDIKIISLRQSDYAEATV